MKFSDYLDRKGYIPYLYHVYTEDDSCFLDEGEYEKYRDYDLEVIEENDYDEEGNNCGVCWGLLMKPRKN